MEEVDVIDLAQDFAYFLLVWSVGVTLTYGLVESSLMMPFRIFLASRGESGWWVESLIYCPYCSGFWIFGMVGGVGYLDWWWAPKMAVMGVTLLLLTRIVHSVKEYEMDEIEAERASRKARKA